MRNRLIYRQVAGCFLLAVLVACKPDYSVVQPVPTSPPPAGPEPTIGYRIKRKTTAGNCYTNLSTDYQYAQGQQLVKEIINGSDRGGGPPVQTYTYNASGRLLTSTYQLMVPQQDGVSAKITSYTYDGNRVEMRTDMVRNGKIDNANYMDESYEYTVISGVTVSSVHHYKEQDGRPMKRHVAYTYVNGNLASLTAWTNDDRQRADVVTYTYDDKPNPFQGRWLPVPNYLNGPNNAVSITSKYSQSPVVLVKPIKYAYNEKGYPVTVLDSDGCSTQFEYETY